MQPDGCIFILFLKFNHTPYLVTLMSWFMGMYFLAISK